MDIDDFDVPIEFQIFSEFGYVDIHTSGGEDTGIIPDQIQSYFAIQDPVFMEEQRELI